MRAKGVPRNRKRKRILKRAEGFIGGRRRLYRTAKESVIRAEVYAYRDRRVRKREFRKLWIIRIGAAARMHGLSYSKFMHGLALAGVGMDRKMLADVALSDPEGFKDLVAVASKALENG